uniref:Uncharacterized protein n=1 Tax=Nelumbo nucifera TaxID=4432 RepID=A0A822XG24_NELNU|nr:TPA_asm: hypothetical protein HUJ06_019514 [Nelumbo nucifera]
MDISSMTAPQQPSLKAFPEFSSFISQRSVPLSKILLFVSYSWTSSSLCFIV